MRQKKERNRKKKQSRWPAVLLVLLFAVGLGILFYPSIANLWNTHMQKQLVSTYETGMEELADGGKLNYEYEMEKARAYNDDLWPTPNPEDFVFLKEEDPSPAYLECLNVLDNSMMGYISVPKIGIEIPIYHGTDEETLLNAAGHLEGTSLPIGGASTHAVIAAHRGLPGSALFTNLDQMEIGDHFFLHVLDETLAYETDQISVVEPDDVSRIVIEDGADLCTLLTCTPYGVNSHRLLVRGHRVELEEEEEETAGFIMTREMWLMLFGSVLAVVGSIIMVRNLRKKKVKGQMR